MGRRKLALSNLDLGQGTPDEVVDRAEEVANRVLDTFGLNVSDTQFENLCDLFDDVALNSDGEIKDNRSVTGVCRAVADAEIPDDVRVAVLLVLLKEPLRRVRGMIRADR
jgi:hypothetical protein